MSRHQASIAIAAFCAVLDFSLPASTWAQGAGPAFWAITDVPPGKGLNVRAQPSMAADPVGTLPRDARGIANLGCRGGTDPAADEAARREQARNRWCRVRYKGLEGWVAGRFLKEDADAPAAPAVTHPPTPQAAAATPPTHPGPRATAPKAPDVPMPPTATPKAPDDPGALARLTFTCTAADAVAVTIDGKGNVVQERHPPREAIRLVLSVTPLLPESAGPVAPAMIWQMRGQQGDRFEGSITWGQAIDSRDGLWRLDLPSRTLHVILVRQGTQAHFYRFNCQ